MMNAFIMMVREEANLFTVYRAYCTRTTACRVPSFRANGPDSEEAYFNGRHRALALDSCLIHK
jgi:hypothetical protein